MKGWLRATGALVGASLGLCASAVAADGPSLPAHAPGPAPAGLVETAPDAVFAPGQVLVRFRDGVDQAGRIGALDGARVRFRKALPLRGAQLVSVPAGGTVAATVRALSRDPRVAYAQPNYIRRLASVPADNWFPQQWALRNTGQSAGGLPAGAVGADVHATGAWDVTTGSPSLTIAVVDTGINFSSPDFAGRLVTGRDFVPSVPDGDPADPAFHSHGTWVSGIIAANADPAGGPGSGIAGIDWNVKVMPLRVFDEHGLTSTDRIVSAFDWAATHGARIVNASFSGAAFSQAESDAIARHPDVLFVTAAGNANSDLDLKQQSDTVTPAYPCAYKLDNILCVAATDQNDARALFSNWGQKAVDVAAPGYNVLTTSVKPGVQVYPVPPGADTFATMANWGIDQASGKNHPVDWGVETTGPFAGTLADSPGGSYSNGTDTAALTTTPINASGLSGCHLAYDLNLALDVSPTPASQDVFSIESISSGAPPLFGAAWVPETVLSGSSGGWSTGRTTELSSINGSQSAWLRFRLQTDASRSADGVHIDNVSVSCGAPANLYTGASDEYLFVDGTSFSAPLVSGIASLVLSLDPSLTPADVKKQIITTSEFKPALLDKTVSDGRVDANAAVRMPPGITPGGATVLGDTAARVTASIRSRRQASTVFVELGTTTAYGDVREVPATIDPANTGDQGVALTLTGLASGTTYHYRFRAVNPTGVPSGVEVGLDQTFTTTGIPTGGTGGVVDPQPPVTPPAPPRPACSKLKGKALATCQRAQKLKRAIAACNKRYSGKKNAKARATCIRRERALSACQVKTGKAKATCLAKARRIR